MGRDESTHTMKSNFNPGESQLNSFRNDMIGQINVNSSGKKRRRIRKSKGTVKDASGMIKATVAGEGTTGPVRPRVVHSKRSVSPIDYSKMRHI